MVTNYMYRQFNTYNNTFCPHSVLICFVWIWEQTAITSLYGINWLVCITESERLLRGTDWTLKCNSGYVSDDKNCTQLFCIKLDSWPTQNGRLHAKDLTALSSVASLLRPSKCQVPLNCPSAKISTGVVGSGPQRWIYCRDPMFVISWDR
jgi:hypothetical protein